MTNARSRARFPMLFSTLKDAICISCGIELFKKPILSLLVFVSLSIR